MSRIYHASAASPTTTVRIGYDDVTEKTLIEYSEDGESWVALDPFDNGFDPDHPPADICHTGQIFVAVGGSQGRYEGHFISVSEDGISWHPVEQAALTALGSLNFNAVSASNPVVIAVGDAGLVAFSTHNGLVWQVVSTSDPETNPFGNRALVDVYIDSGHYYIVGDHSLYSGPISELGSLVILSDGISTSTEAAGTKPAIEAQLSAELVVNADLDRQFARIHERARVQADALRNLNKQKSTAEDVLEVTSLTRFYIDAEATSTLSVDDSAAVFASVSIFSTLALTAAVESYLPPGEILRARVVMSALSDAIIETAITATILETLSLSDVLTAKQKFAANLAVAVGLTGAAAASFSLRIQDSLAMTTFLNAYFGVRLAEAIQVDSTTFADITPAQQAIELMETWVYNTEGQQSSRYENFEMLSLVATKRGVYATDGSSLYALEGTTDDGKEIPCAIEWGVTDFGTAFEKGMDRVYLGVASSGQLVLRVTTNKRIEDWYQVVLDPDSGQHGSRIKIGKGLRARYWKFRLESFDGEGFDLESIEFKPVTMSRRVR